MGFRNGIAIALATTGLLTAGHAWGGQIGGLASLLKPGGVATSVTVGYAEQDVKDGHDDKVSSFRNVFRAEVGVADALALYAIVGISDLKFEDAEFKGTRGGSFGGGLRYGLVSSADSSLRLILNLEAEYFGVSDGPGRVTRQAYHVATYALKEFGAAGSVGYFYPFGGFQISYASYNGKHEMGDYRNKDVVGFLAGADYFVSPNVYFSGEVHLFDETSLYLTAGYRF